jgi:hypothetical protein
VGTQNLHIFEDKKLADAIPKRNLKLDGQFYFTLPWAF